MKQFVVIGLGRFGLSLAETLYDLGHDVLGIDIDEEIVQNVADSITHAVKADATDENALRALGVRNFDVAVVSIGNDIQASILVTLILKEMGIKYVVAKAQNELHGKVLYKIGADRIVFPERDMGIRVAHNLTLSNILDYIELSPEYSIIEISAISSWFNKSLSQLNMRRKYGLNVIAIKRDGDVIISPNGDDVILKGDVLAVVGQKHDIENMEKHL
ncbi:Ktr system potassium uptake protein C [Tepidanaerobacter acetatoxydans Re1]|uniref:Ktr system potassium uptake protein C n=1 Tax=Tepidanaerobacter acetatoxydans (strain DSM 21804 / JCM 16047 / Re1) TaxID=1209989 RepID=F4LW85_TEPAE|nr:TrkA family potassium uptake protein [Tepidanaerobacter acetatoxydans]AEE90861.1 TrkA-N domain protein [Tepidanaerobacter acetatoxydans Re1]CCP25425.1 Ktr system potassium uptake protein C [Tepidanaerobacter acetatoxydans Re1]